MLKIITTQLSEYLPKDMPYFGEHQESEEEYDDFNEDDTVKHFAGCGRDCDWCGNCHYD